MAPKRGSSSHAGCLFGLQVTSCNQHVFVSCPVWRLRRSRFGELASGSLYFDKGDGYVGPTHRSAAGETKMTLRRHIMGSAAGGLVQRRKATADSEHKIGFWQKGGLSGQGVGLLCGQPDRSKACSSRPADGGPCVQLMR